MIDVEVLDQRATPSALPPLAEVHRLSARAAACAGVHEGHLAIELVDAERIVQLNAQYRDVRGPTDVLSFPVDGRDPVGAPRARELGDVVICPEHTRDLREAIVHGVLHLVGFDHEVDSGEMLALQRRLLMADDASRDA
jgi:probable rRNA maturation factor